MLSHESPEHRSIIHYNCLMAITGIPVSTLAVYSSAFFCIIKHNPLIFLLCLLWELVSIFWQIFATLLTNDKLIAICLRLQWISDSELPNNNNNTALAFNQDLTGIISYNLLSNSLERQKKSHSVHPAKTGVNSLPLASSRVLCMFAPSLCNTVFSLSIDLNCISVHQVLQLNKL